MNGSPITWCLKLGTDSLHSPVSQWKYRWVVFHLTLSGIWGSEDPTDFRILFVYRPWRNETQGFPSPLRASTCATCAKCTCQDSPTDLTDPLFPDCLLIHYIPFFLIVINFIVWRFFCILYMHVVWGCTTFIVPLSLMWYLHVYKKYLSVIAMSHTLLLNF